MLKLKKLLTEGINNIQFTPEEKQFIQKVKAGQEEIDNASDELMTKFYEFFNETMPYGTMKARTGDPYEWIMNHLDEIPLGENKEYGRLVYNENNRKIYQQVDENKVFHIGNIGEFNGKPMLSYIYSKKDAQITEAKGKYRELNDYEKVLAEKAMTNPAYKKYLELAHKITGLRIRL